MQTPSTYGTAIIKKGTGVKKKNKFYILILFLISPFLSFLMAIRNYRSSWAKNAVLLFIAFHGYTMVISNETMDANSYRDKFLQMSESNLSFGSFIGMFYEEGTQYVDVAQPLITYLVALFTTNYKILFLVFALIFGYFYSRNIWYLLDKVEGKLKKENIVLIFTFAIIIGFWQINGFRMWTAAHIFFYGTIRYLYEKKKKGLFLASLSILMHFSFILPVLVLLTYSLSKNRVHVYFWLFIATFFIAEINFEALNQILQSIVPDVFSNKVDAYTHGGSGGNKKETVENWSWHARYYGRALRWTIIAFISIIYFKGLSILKGHSGIFSVYSFALLFLAIANVVSLIPSGGRFYTIASLFAIAAIFLYTQHFQTGGLMKRFMPFAKIALIFYCIVAFRIGLDTIGIMAILGNFIIEIFVNVDMALIELIK